MGRNQGFERQQFADTGLPKRGNRSQVVCKHCLAAYSDPTRTNAPPEPKVIAARDTNYTSHLKRCKYYQEAVGRGDVTPPQVQQTILQHFLKQSATNSAPSSAPSSAPMFGQRSASSFSEEASSASSDKRQRGIREYFNSVFSMEEQEEFERLLIQFQADNCLPDRFIEKLSTLRRACVRALPKRKGMGLLLDKYSKVEEECQVVALRNRLQFSGGRLNFLSDVWMNVVKLHLLGCMLALFGTIVTYGLFPTGSRHDGVAIAEQMEKVMKEIEAKNEWKIGAVVTDNAGQCGRARRILALRRPRIAFVHCFAHDINNLVKAVLTSSFRELTKQASLATVTLNASSSKWLVRAKQIITTTYGKPLGLINLCETRWNSMQGCFASLLRVRSALFQFWVEYDDFPEALNIFGDPTFWRKLDTAEEVIRPLSNVSYKLQRDENTLADIVVSYRDIYRGFLSNFDNMDLVSLVEKRWQQCEQPLMLLALFLHPLHVHVAVAIHNETPELRFLERLCGYGIYYYRRFVEVGNESYVESLSNDLHNWFCGAFVNSSIVRFNGDVGKYWSFARSVKQKSKLPKLASVILSIAVNTATCERYFSELAAIHTALKNRMSIDKARKFSLIRQTIRLLDKEESEGAERSEIKRIVAAVERMPIGNCDMAPPISLEEMEENRVIVYQDTPASDTTEYWQDIFNVLDGDDSTCEELPCTQNEELEQKVFDGFDEDIPEPDTTEFPHTNVKNFPQETKLTGIRCQKFRLVTLFHSESTFGLTPYVTQHLT